MDAIFKNLQDPSWWFTAFIVGIIASVVAGFTKDYLEKTFGLFLLRTKLKRAQARLARDEKIKAWSQNESLVMIILLRAHQLKIAVLALFAVNIMILVTLHFRGNDADLPIYAIAALGVLILFTFWAAWKSSAQTSLTRDCFQHFRRSRGLPSG
jgi:hypothetical protein